MTMHPAFASDAVSPVPSEALALPAPEPDGGAWLTGEEYAVDVFLAALVAEPAVPERALSAI